MKLLITNGHLNIGGVERSLITLLKSIDYSEHQVDLMLFEGMGEYRDQLPPEVNVIPCELTSTYGPLLSVIESGLRRRDGKTILYKLILLLANRVNRRFIKMFRWFHLDASPYDAALAYRVGFPAEYVSYVAKAGKKLVWWHHGDFDYAPETVSQWQAMMGNMDHIVCVSEASRTMILPHFPGCETKMTVIPNMIDLSDIREKAERFHPYGDRHGGEKILVSVGRFSAEKHMDDAVLTMKQLRERGYTNLIWYLIGDGPERPVIESHIAEFGLEEHVILTGNQENPYPYIQDADIYVHPSHTESQGIAVLEAMALAKLCVVVRSEGTNEFVTDGYNALQAERTVESLTKRIMDALKQHPADTLRARAVETAEDYRPAAIMPRLLQLLSR